MIMEQSKLADYNLWANDRVRNLLSGLTEEEFSRHVLPPYDSIRNLVAHIVLAVEFNLVMRVDGGEIDADDLWESLSRMTEEELLGHWRDMDLRLKWFASNRLDLDAVFPNFLSEGKIKVNHDDYLNQYLIHTVHHRAQIMSALRLMGEEAVGTDYLFYLSALATAHPS
jgi:uncharacterized damage-inducible protein DinB